MLCTRSVYTKSKGQKNQRPRRKFPQAPSGQVTKCLPAGPEQTIVSEEADVQRIPAEVPLVALDEPVQVPDAVFTRNTEVDPCFPSFSRQSRVFDRIELTLDFLRHLTAARETALLLGASFELVPRDVGFVLLQKTGQFQLADVDSHLVLLATALAVAFSVVFVCNPYITTCRDCRNEKIKTKVLEKSRLTKKLSPTTFILILLIYYTCF